MFWQLGRLLRGLGEGDKALALVDVFCRAGEVWGGSPIIVFFGTNDGRLRSWFVAVSWKAWWLLGLFQLRQQQRLTKS